MALRRITVGLFVAAMIGFAGLPTTCPAAEPPQRAVLFIIDGLHWQAPEKLGLKHIRALAQEGASFRQAWLVPPAHPRSGAWAEIHNSGPGPHHDEAKSGELKRHDEAF